MKRFRQAMALGMWLVTVAFGTGVSVVQWTGSAVARPSTGSATILPGSATCGDRPPGDVDGNCESNLEDYAAIAPCLSGPNATNLPAGCLLTSVALANFDSDADRDADMLDFAVFQAGFGGMGGFTIPSDWGGTWQVTLTSRGCVSNELVAVEEFEELVCPGESFAEGLISLFDGCPGVQVGDTLMADCQRDFSVGGCAVHLNLQLDVLRSGEILSGEAQWFGELEGLCELLGTAPCEVVTIEGQRISADTQPCTQGREVQP